MKWKRKLILSILCDSLISIGIYRHRSLLFSALYQARALIHLTQFWVYPNWQLLSSQTSGRILNWESFPALPEDAGNWTRDHLHAKHVLCPELMTIGMYIFIRGWDPIFTEGPVFWLGGTYIVCEAGSWQRTALPFLNMPSVSPQAIRLRLGKGWGGLSLRRAERELSPCRPFTVCTELTIVYSAYVPPTHPPFLFSLYGIEPCCTLVWN